MAFSLPSCNEYKKKETKNMEIVVQVQIQTNSQFAVGEQNSDFLWKALLYSILYKIFVTSYSFNEKASVSYDEYLVLLWIFLAILSAFLSIHQCFTVHFSYIIFST